MSVDLLSYNFIENIDTVLIRRVINGIKVFLFLSVIYSLVELWQWYFYLQQEKLPAAIKKIDFYNYRIFPAVLFVIVITRMFGWIFYLKGNRLIYASFQNKEAELFNEGYKICYKSVLIMCISFIIIIANLLIRLFLRL